MARYRVMDKTALSPRSGGPGLPPNTSQQRPLTARGEVAITPLAETDDLQVVVQSVTRQFGITIPAGNWSARGSALPAQGAECLVVFDDLGDAFVPIWQGSTVLPSGGSSGPAGGDLSGTFPNPEVATVLGGETPLAVDGSGNSMGAQLLSSHQFVVDDNGGTFYSVSVSAAANSWGSTAFTTLRSSWSYAIPVGAIYGQPFTPAFWSYTLTSPHTFTIYVANNSGGAGTYTWYGVVIGH